MEPIHFDIRGYWYRNIRDLRLQAPIREAFDRLHFEWVCMARSQRELAEKSDPAAARAEYELSLHTARVRLYDRQWITQTFAPEMLTELQLAICEYLRPELDWEAIDGEHHAVVADKRRLLVCDVKLCDHLSAEASLLYAEDDRIDATVETQLELRAFLHAENLRDQERLKHLYLELDRMRPDLMATAN